MKLRFKKLAIFTLLLALMLCLMPISIVKANEDSRFCGYGTTISAQSDTTETISFTKRVPVSYQTVNGVAFISLILLKFVIVVIIVFFFECVEQRIRISVSTVASAV